MAAYEAAGGLCEGSWLVQPWTSKVHVSAKLPATCWVVPPPNSTITRRSISKANAALERAGGAPLLTAGAKHPAWLRAPEALAVASPGAMRPHAVRATAMKATQPSLLIESAIEAANVTPCYELRAQIDAPTTAGRTPIWRIASVWLSRLAMTSA